MTTVKRNESVRKAHTIAARKQIQTAIRRLRREMNLTQAELGKKLVTPVDQATISNWECGKSDLSACQLLDIMMIFGQPNFMSLLEQGAQSDLIDEPQSA
ncbi:helix-turn-helix transcriptional regulator [Pseudoalteromonas sp. OOF1S-7]|uniref:helix-turn-helix domain-containing protein n=1 Tax=Pseudoalteromonas sp. OOF1S-7 TaxID=2917757 RepID=UPI001EF53539|nr:helix-turn-helix transcriptional regulator [Pseudoalteromonas sp. OOF1S-7]MCG7537432.1 helix-turn-helix domain-containing protein [Pseudoalteromonas sp. OOF1S-7]